MTSPVLTFFRDHWSVTLDPLDHPEFFARRNSGAWTLGREFRGWLQDNDPNHFRYKVQTLYCVEFSSEDAAMMFRLRFGASILRSGA